MAKAYCPICKKTLEGDFKNIKNHPFFPFCSQRCKLVDLQGWLSGRYRFSSPIKSPDVIGESTGQAPSPPVGEGRDEGKQEKHENTNEETSETS